MVDTTVIEETLCILTATGPNEKGDFTIHFKNSDGSECSSLKLNENMSFNDETSMAAITFIEWYSTWVENRGRGSNE